MLRRGYAFAVTSKLLNVVSAHCKTGIAPSLALTTKHVTALLSPRVKQLRILNHLIMH